MNLKRAGGLTALVAAAFIGGYITHGSGSNEADYAGKKIVPVIDLKGVIAATLSKENILSSTSGTLNIDGLKGVIDKAFDTPNAVAVALDINSPGGSPTQSELIANEIRKKAAEKHLPVYTFVQDMAASGGYWLACAADEIYTSRTSTIGSIGVAVDSMGYAGLADMLGVESRTYTAGAHKRRLDPMKPENPEDVAWLQKELDAMHEIFKDEVKECRKDKLPADSAVLNDTVFSGDHWLGEEAHALGLTDGIGEMETVLRAKFGDDIVITHVKKDVSALMSIMFGAAANDLPALVRTLGEGIGAGVSDSAAAQIQSGGGTPVYQLR